MGLEAATYIHQLVTSNPDGGDDSNTLDNHIRLVKSAIQNTLPNVQGAVNVSHTELNYLVGVTSAVQTQIDQAFRSAYPVGSIYINATNATNPGTLLGFGTWVAFGAGRVPVGFDSGDTDFDTAEETGGSKDSVVVSHTHTGTTDSDGAHSHTGVPTTSYDANSGSGPLGAPLTGSTDSAGAHTHSFTTDSEGVSGVGQNLQPYITVYMWKRTA